MASSGSGDVTAASVDSGKSRTYNPLNKTYFLPADNEEWKRLDKQHSAITLGLGGPYPAPLTFRAVLAPEAGQTKTILDVGCGSGIWARSMAEEFPNVEILGIDLAPPPTDDTWPQNCKFETCDVHEGLNHLEGQFDMVHARLIGSGVRNFRQAKEDMEKCLKPGGIILIMDVDYNYITQDPMVYHTPASDTNPNGSWVARISYEMGQAAIASGRTDVLGMREVLKNGLWNDSLMDPDTCLSANLYIPYVPGEDDPDPEIAQRLKNVSQMFQENFLKVHRDLHPLFIKAGWSKEVVEEWSRKAEEEMKTRSIPISLRFIWMWGRRRESTGLPAPPLQIRSNNEQEKDEYPSRPYFHIFHKPEEAEADTALRNRTRPADSVTTNKGA